MRGEYLVQRSGGSGRLVAGARELRGARRLRRVGGEHALDEARRERRAGEHGVAVRVLKQQLVQLAGG